jgi:hypothetical protein
MKNTLLVETLKLLAAEDLDEFMLFLKSEFNNRSKLRVELLRLFGYLQPLYPHFDTTMTHKEVLYPIAFPGTPVYAGKIEKLIGELYKLLKDFLLWKHYQDQEGQFNRALDWVKVIRSLNDSVNYESSLAQVEKSVFEKKEESPILYFQKFLLEYERHEWMSQINRGRNDLNLNKALMSLYTFYEIYKLEFLNQLYLQQKLTQFEVSEIIVNYIDTGVESGIDKNTVVIADISSKIYELLKKEQPNQADFEYLLDNLRKQEQVLAPATLKSYFAHLRNICTILINTGHTELQTVQLYLYKDNLSRGYLYFEGKLHITTLANVTRIAIRSGEVDWALDCVESHKNKLFGDVDTHEYYLVNKANCLFEKKEYEQVLDHLPNSSPNISYHLIARRLELMCYYELKSELLFSKMEAFKVYIWRVSEKILSDAVRDANKNFINLLIQLVSIPTNDQSKRERLEKRILEKKRVAEIRWLLAKVRDGGK